MQIDKLTAEKMREDNTTAEAVISENMVPVVMGINYNQRFFIAVEVFYNRIGVRWAGSGVDEIIAVFFTDKMQMKVPVGSSFWKEDMLPWYFPN